MTSCTDSAGQEGLYDAKGGANHGDGGDHPCQHPEKREVQRPVGRKEGRVEDFFDEHRVDHTQPGIQYDQQPDD